MSGHGRALRVRPWASGAPSHLQGPVGWRSLRWLMSARGERETVRWPGSVGEGGREAERSGGERVRGEREGEWSGGPSEDYVAALPVPWGCRRALDACRPQEAVAGLGRTPPPSSSPPLMHPCPLSWETLFLYPNFLGPSPHPLPHQCLLSLHLAPA